MRIAAGAMALLFVFAASVQWNDPDPLRWIAIYLAAAAASGAAAFGRPSRAACLAVALVAAAWSAFLLPAMLGARGEAFTSIEMKAPEDEAPREALGLGLVAGWSAGLGLWIGTRSERSDGDAAR